MTNFPSFLQTVFGLCIYSKLDPLSFLSALTFPYALLTQRAKNLPSSTSQSTSTSNNVPGLLSARHVPSPLCAPRRFGVSLRRGRHFASRNLLARRYDVHLCHSIFVLLLRKLVSYLEAVLSTGLAFLETADPTISPNFEQDRIWNLRSPHEMHGCQWGHQVCVDRKKTDFKDEAARRGKKLLEFVDVEVGIML